MSEQLRNYENNNSGLSGSSGISNSTPVIGQFVVVRNCMNELVASNSIDITRENVLQIAYYLVYIPQQNSVII